MTLFVPLSTGFQAEYLHPRDGNVLTSALGLLTSFLRNKNCRFRFERSIVSKSRRVMSRKPDSTTFFTITRFSRSRSNVRRNHHTEFAPDTARANNKDTRS